MQTPKMTAEQSNELRELQMQVNTTRRPVSEELEKLLYAPIPVLDHGFVRVVDYMGDDAAVVQAARVSYGRGTTKVSDDRGLIRYLMRHRHTTPFEMAEIKLHCKLPIFVARQWIRHRVASVNEVSARYSILDKEFYIPEPEHLGVQSSTNRQGRGDTLNADQARVVLEMLRTDSERAYEQYQYLLNEDETGQQVDPSRDGLARELARMELTLNYYTQWYWKVDLHNLLRFLALRMDSHAQYEIRVYGNAIGKVVAAWVPHSWEAFQDYIFSAVTFSGPELRLLNAILQNGHTSVGAAEAIGVKRREWDEFGTKLDRVKHSPIALPLNDQVSVNDMLGVTMKPSTKG